MTMPLLATVPISIRWRDLDAFNHVNNANFLTYLEEARLAWLAGIDGEWFSSAQLPVIAASQLNYRAQLEWPGSVQVELHCQRVGGSSLTIAHRIVSMDGSQLYCDGHVVLVWIDPKLGRPVPLPDALRAACG